MKVNKLILSAILLTLLVFTIGLLLKRKKLNQTVDITPPSQPGTGFTKELLNKLDIPFLQKQDMLISESAFRPCGNCSMELPVVPGTEDMPYIEKLSILANRKMPPTDGFTRITDTVQIYSVLNRGDEDAFRTKKIYVLVTAEMSKQNGRVNVYENYLHGDTFKQVLKEFDMAKKGAWLEVDHRKAQ